MVQPHHPATALSGLSILGGIIGFSTVGSMPSLLGGVGVGSLLAMSALRVKDHCPYGHEAAAFSSFLLLAATGRRALKVRAPIPVTMATLAAASTVYYLREVVNHQKI